MRKDTTVVWHYNGRIRINGRMHKHPSPTIAALLVRVLARLSFYQTLHPACIVYTVRRGKGN